MQASEIDLLATFRAMRYDDLANLGIRLEKIIERGREVGANSATERRKLQLVDQVLREQEAARAN